MVTDSHEIREQQRAAWNTFSGGWKKHDAFVTRWLAPLGQKLLESARLQEGFAVLDAATGTGEPGLTAARRVGQGRVIGSDIAAEMLKVAEEKARATGISNYETKLCNESSLPFPKNTFDAVVCRLGIMYFPDMSTASRELARVAKPERVVALSAWAEPSKNPWGTIAARIINQMLAVPPPPAGTPGLFRCATPGALSGLLRQTGLGRVAEVEVSGTVGFASAEHYWEFITGVVAPIATALSKVDPGKRESVRHEVIEAVRTEYGHSVVSLLWSAWVASGIK